MAINNRARLLPSPGEMVKDPGAGAPINIDTRAAVGAVTLDVRGAMAADLGQAKMGEAIADAGSYLSQLAVKQMQAINVTKVAEAQDIMTEAESNMKVAMLKEPDELKWEGIAAEHATMAQGRISKMALSPVAKQQVDSDFSRWQAHRTGQVKVDSARQSFDKVTTKLKNQLLINMERQDPEGFADNLMGGKQLGILTDEDIELQQLKYAERGKQLLAEKEADDYKNGVTAAVAVAAASGEQAALGELERGAMGNLNALQKERVRGAIQSVARDRAQTIIGEVTEDIVNGTLEDESQIKAINSPHMTPALKKHAMDILRDFNADEARKDREVNGVRNAVELRRKVKDYDSSTDPDRTKYFTLVKEIGARAEQTAAGEITGELYQKYGGKPPKMQVRPEIEQNVSQSLDITFDPEIGAIPWRRKVPVLDGKGKPVLDSNDNPKFTVVDDLAAKQQALDAQTVIEIEMSKWFALHPDKAGDIGAVQEALQLALPAGTRMAALLGIQREKQSKSVNAEPPNLGAEGDRGPAGAEFLNPMGANNPAYAPVGGTDGTGGTDFVREPTTSRVTSYAYEKEELPDSNSKAGIGAFVPDKEQAKIKRGEESPYKLREGDLAVSRDVEARLRKAGIRPGDEVEVQIEDGTNIVTRWMDRTGVNFEGKILTGRWDFYRAGKNSEHPKDARRVIGFRRANFDQ